VPQDLECPASNKIYIERLWHISWTEKLRIKSAKYIHQI
jgi:hypothetical protein